VFVRIRPLNKRKIAEDQTIGWNFNDTSLLEDTQNGARKLLQKVYCGMDSAQLIFQIFQIHLLHFLRISLQIYTSASITFCDIIAAVKIRG
jgi:hypothetical protein